MQDDWRWRSNVTVNLGLRYEMVTVPTEVHGKLDNLPTLSSATQTLGDPVFANPTLRNFEPRVGFAWDPFKNGKTAVRGGFGLFDSLPLLYQIMLVEGTSAPFFEKGTISGAICRQVPFLRMRLATCRRLACSRLTTTQNRIAVT